MTQADEETWQKRIDMNLFAPGGPVIFSTYLKEAAKLDHTFAGDFYWKYFVEMAMIAAEALNA